MAPRARLGELLVQQGLLTQETIDQALRTQVGGNRRLGHILVRMKVISDDQLAEVLASQLEIPLCDINTMFSPEVRKTVPRYLCRQYSVLPLANSAHNIIQIAMADPADTEAINDIENYTGRVVEPFLARCSDIDREIPLRIPLSMQDFFSPRSNILLTRIGVSCCLILILLLGGFTYKYIRDVTYGTISVTSDATLYKNLDLMIGFDTKGKITLLGRGNYSKSYYSVTFNDVNMLKTFLATRQSDFSDRQKSWLDWVIMKQQPFATGSLAIK
jgi:hypothetical protein